MNGILDKNSQQGQFKSGDVLTTAPPPPAEVKIRTMRGDIAMLAANGGAAPRFKEVQVAGLSAQKATPASIARTESKNNLLLIILLVVVVAALVVVGWLVYQRLGG